jgi:hypothetical protein
MRRITLVFVGLLALLFPLNSYGQYYKEVVVPKPNVPTETILAYYALGCTPVPGLTGQINVEPAYGTVVVVSGTYTNPNCPGVQFPGVQANYTWTSATGQPGSGGDAFTFAQDETRDPSVKYSFRPINFPGATGTFAYAINNRGEVVGFYTGGACCQASYGFTDLKGKFKSIECVLENATDFFDISNKGEIVGAYSYSGGVNGFIWEGVNSCAPLSDSSPLTEAWGVNDSGTIVGYYEDAFSNDQGFKYVNGKYTIISCKGWTNTRALGINDAGLIVGDVWNIKTSHSGFLYKSGKCTTFDYRYPKATSTTAAGINKSDQISGWYTDSKGADHGFVKTGSDFKALNYPNAVGTLAFHLNDAGQVAGFYEDTSGGFHGFVATPKD